MTGYPRPITPVNHVAPSPRRVRAVLGGETVVDTQHALYVWEHPPFPQYYIPIADVREGILVAEGHTEETPRGTVELHALRAGDAERPSAGRVLRTSTVDGLADTVRFDWNALDAWYEEDEQVFVHPRDPYSRVDALRSTRTLSIARDGVTLAETRSPVMVFETGLPTRYYVNRTDVRFDHLRPSDTVTACPYKGRTSGYWSAHIGGRVHRDIAWAYDFPTHQLAPIAGLVAFYNERVDIVLDGHPLERPRTHFWAGDD